MTDMKGSFVYKVVRYFFNEKHIPMSNILVCVIDFAATVTSCYHGVIVNLKKVVLGVIAVHYHSP